ncbi:MAG: aminotransferase class I/II-fold pyridoxal phosphate-dependent enzyme [Bifidobacterium adolescentis]
MPAEGVLVLYSLSKQSNMAGYRTAFIAGDEVFDRTMKVHIASRAGQIIPGPVQAAMAAGLRDLESGSRFSMHYRERLGVLVSALRAYGYCTDMPDGALYVWVRAKSGDCWTDGSSLPRLASSPAPASSSGAPECLRFSTTASDEAIASAAERLAR